MEFQHIPEWYISRLGKFTGSEFHKLMTGGRRDMTPEELEAEKKSGGKRKTVDTMFGDTALGYIDDKISEIITNGTCLDFKKLVTKETEWGNYWEPYARESFVNITGIEVNQCGFIDISERFGCSPDGKTEFAALEIKCPYNTSVHVRNLRLKDGQGLKILHPEYYVQMQIEMIALKKNLGYFVSFDPRCSEKLQLKVVQVNRDEQMIYEILRRKDEALKILNASINEFFEMTKTFKIAV